MSVAIAVVGMACRYPEASTPSELWENVLAQRRAFRRMPPERLRLEDYHAADRDAPDRVYSTQAAVIEGYEFDRVRFRVTGTAFRSADHVHWLALEAAADALGDAGFPDGDGLPRESTGVLVGNSLTGEFSRANLMRLRWPYVRRVVAAALLAEGWSEERCGEFLGRLEGAYKAPYPPVTEETLAGGLSNTIAGRICNHFDLQGGGYTVDGACASSLLAVGGACSALAAGELDVAVAGGVDLSLDPFELVGFAKTGALAQDEMRVYDRDSAGFWPGEGCGMVVLMRQADALAQGRPAYALIRGWGVSSDGGGGITRPEASGQLLALRRAYRRAGFGIETVAYFEGHGTGTAVGDATELRVLSTARREAEAEGLAPARLGSIKANIGHTKAAAGVAGLIKTSLALHHQVIPPHAGADRPHPELTGEDAVLRLPRRPEPWPEDRELRAAVSAMGFGGINTHVVLEGTEAERRASLGAFELELGRSAQDAELFLLSAPDAAGLAEGVEELLRLSAVAARSELADLSAELGRRLGHGPARAAVVASTPGELEERLEGLRRRLAEGAAGPQAPPLVEPRSGLFAGSATAPRRIGFLFPGQGSPAHLDGGALRRRFAPVAELYEGADPPAAGDGVETSVAQPAIARASVAGLRVLETLGIRGAVAVGHSLGELTSLYWAGAYGCKALLRIAAARGRAMGELGDPTGAMAAIEADAQEVRPLLAEGAVLAGFNGPRQTVVSGPGAVVEAVVREARSRGLSARRLPVSHAFHSPLVAAAAPRLESFLAGESFQPLRRTVASTITGRVLEPEADLKALLVTQITGPVRFAEALAAVGERVGLWIEVGPGRVLGGLVEGLSERPVISMDAGGESLRGTLEAVGAAFACGMPIHGSALSAGRFTRPFDLGRRRRFFTSPCEAAPDALPRLSAPLSANLPADLPAGLPPEPVAAVPGAGADGGEKPGASVTDGDPRDPAAVVRALVARRAELPETAVAPHHRLLSDLHLNSISVGQVVVDAARELGLAAPVAPTEFADATVDQISAALARLSSTGGAASEERPEGPPPGVDSWVRVFTVETVERPLNEAEAPAGSGDWQVLAPPGHPLAEPLEAAFGAAGRGGGVVLCLPEEVGEGEIELLLEAAHEVARREPPCRLVVVQRGGGGGGFARTLHLEMPEVPVSVCDLPFDHPGAAGWVVAEALACEGFVEARYDAEGVRREPVLRAVPPEDEAEAAEPGLGPDDVLLVTGGAKGIAAEAALALARETGVRLALLGRSAPDRDPELARNLERFSGAGIPHIYVAADVTDGEAVAAAFRRAEEELGPVTAVLHGAGINDPCLLGALEPEPFRRTVAVKVEGARNLLAAADPDRLRLFVAFGSIIARIGMPGEADYAVANEWLARLVEGYGERHPGCWCLVVEWSVWSGVGMGERLGRIEALSRQGITAIPPDRGVAILRSLLSRPPRRTAVVVTGRFGDPPTLRPEPEELPMGRFLERSRVHYPGVELVVESTLSPATDPYLTDHVFRGELLLPAVLGLEAMAQVTRAVTGDPRLPVFEEVELGRPVAVPPDRPLTVRLAALRRGRDRVEVALRSEATGFQVDHFRAVCRLADGPVPEHAPAADPPARTPAWIPAWIEEAAEPRALPIRPETDLYGRILFHEGRFRRLERYLRLRATECVAEISPDGAALWFGAYLPADLLLGDPAVRDAAIHGIQPCIPHATVLPVGVERIRAGRLDGQGPWRLSARERSRESRTFVYDLELRDREGEVRERWEGLRLRAVEDLGAPPAWATSLLAPYVERRLQELVPTARVAVALEAEPETDRTAASDRVLARLLGPDAVVRRRPDGKPELDGGLQVSLAHAGDLVLAVTAPGALGCDLEPVVQRSEADWRALLGSERYRLARALVEAGEPPAAAATRLWTAMECLKKVGAPHDTPLVLGEGSADGWRLLENGSQVVATLVAPVPELGGDASIAVLLGDDHASV